MRVKEDVRGIHQTKEWMVVEKTWVKKFKGENSHRFSNRRRVKCVTEWLYDCHDATK